MGKAHRQRRIQGHCRRVGLTTLARHSTDPDAPIGVFDSGIGGLSVLQALRAALSAEDFVYVADSAYTPYGERGDAFVAQRTERIAHALRDAYRVKALVIACNTASAAAAHALRRANPGWPIVAIEPALKPAAHATRTGHVGVLATRGTLASAKYAALRAALKQAHPDVRFNEQPCDGLASAIEQWALDDDGARTRSLLTRYLEQIGPEGDGPGQIDTLVLGCTHYPLIREQIAHRTWAGLTLIDAGTPVARQTHRLLHATGLLRLPTPTDTPAPAGRLRLLATGGTETLRAAAQRWLDAGQTVEAAPMD